MTRSIRERLASQREGADGAHEAAEGDQANWFVIHTYSGYENKVRQNLMHRVETMDVADRIFEVIVPIVGFFFTLWRYKWHWQWRLNLS